jgi:hypothetical protein
MSTDRCPSTWGSHQCQKDADHNGVHYADTNDDCGVGWINYEEVLFDE